MFLVSNLHVVRMPSNFIANLRGYSYPSIPNYNLGDIDHCIWNRYYQAYIHRLIATGFHFPPPHTYHAQFGHKLPSSFVSTTPGDLVLDPGLDSKWLIFVHVDDILARILVGRYVARSGKLIQLFGDAPEGLELKFGDGVVVSGVVVSSHVAESLRVEGVVFL